MVLKRKEQSQLGVLEIWWKTKNGWKVHRVRVRPKATVASMSPLISFLSRNHKSQL